MSSNRMFQWLVAGLIVALLPVSANACWSVHERKEIEGFSELDNRLVLSFRDAVDCRPVDNATVKLGELAYQTDAFGNLELPMKPFASQMDKRIPISVERDGYITLDAEIVVAAGTVIKRRMVMSGSLPPGKLRFILQWEDEPEDLDLHLKGPDFHISYRKMRFARDRASLDRDELDGYGPETITLDRIQPGSTYDVYVDNFSNESDFTGGETLSIYSGNTRLKHIELESGSERAVHVMRITAERTEVINKPSSRP